MQQFERIFRLHRLLAGRPLPRFSMPNIGRIPSSSVGAAERSHVGFFGVPFRPASRYRNRRQRKNRPRRRSSRRGREGHRRHPWRRRELLAQRSTGERASCVHRRDGTWRVCYSGKAPRVLAQARVSMGSMGQDFRPCSQRGSQSRRVVACQPSSGARCHRSRLRRVRRPARRAARYRGQVHRHESSRCSPPFSQPGGLLHLLPS